MRINKQYIFRFSFIYEFLHSEKISIKKEGKFVEIEIEAFDRVGVLKDILAEIAESKTNVCAAKVSTKRGSSAFLRLTVDVKDVKHLEQVNKLAKNMRRLGAWRW